MKFKKSFVKISTLHQSWTVLTTICCRYIHKFSGIMVDIPNTCLLAINNRFKVNLLVSIQYYKSYCIRIISMAERRLIKLTDDGLKFGVLTKQVSKSERLDKLLYFACGIKTIM